jgi:heat shock protein HtpX
MRFRIAVSLVLMIGFYALALGVSGALLWVVSLELRSFDRIDLRATFFCLLTAGAILWSLLPRRDRFEAPGPRLTAETQPELFALVHRVAAETNQQMPAEVYLVPEVNAWVSHRGGMMGIGSRRVMGIGLTLLQSVSIAQLRAILAHEFGHYAGGDTRLGAWVYKTREAMRRTIQNLAQTSAWIHTPFLWYANLFLRVSQTVSRQQELAADRLAARVAGGKVASDALIAVHGAALAYGSYWQQELIPVLSNGYRPPIAAGFSAFLRADSIADAVSKQVKTDLHGGTADRYDSHPPLKERIAALAHAGGESRDDVDALAVNLLRELPRLESELLQTLFSDPQKARELQSVEWEETGARVFLPVWRDESTRHKDVFHALRAIDVPRFFMAPDALQRLRLTHLLPNDRLRAVRNAIGCGLAARLFDAGWACDATPGRPVVFEKEGRRFAPFALAHRLGTDGFGEPEWTTACDAAGVGEMTLA